MQHKTEVAPGVFQPDPGTVTEAAHAAQTERLLTALPFGDVLEELAEAEGPLLAAIQREDAAAIGRIVLNVRRAYAMRMADRLLFDGDVVGTPSAEEAATAALLDTALDKASPRRFSGAAITGWGALS